MVHEFVRKTLTSINDTVHKLFLILNVLLEEKTLERNQ